jgi:hypothetical protein
VDNPINLVDPDGHIAAAVAAPLVFIPGFGWVVAGVLGIGIGVYVGYRIAKWRIAKAKKAEKAKDALYAQYEKRCKWISKQKKPPSWKKMMYVEAMRELKELLRQCE